MNLVDPLLDGLLTPALAAKLERWSTTVFPVATPARIATTLRDHGIGVVDLDRQRCLVDERVYEGALYRGRIGRLFLTQRHPSPATWRWVAEAAQSHG